MLPMARLLNTLLISIWGSVEKGDYTTSRRLAKTSFDADAEDYGTICSVQVPKERLTHSVLYISELYMAAALQNVFRVMLE